MTGSHKKCFIVFFKAEFMKKVIAECTSKVRGEYKKDEKKIILYAAHEKNLGVILDLLKIPPHIPSYTSAIIFELHKNLRTSRHEIKVIGIFLKVSWLF